MYQHIIKVKLPKFRLTCCWNSFSFSRKLQCAESQEVYQGIFPEGKIVTCTLVFDRSEDLYHSRGNMCCLGRYKEVILLLGTCLLRNHFMSPFSLHRSLYLISYSGVWLPQTGRTPFIFIWKTHLALEGWQTMEAKSRGFGCGRDCSRVLHRILTSSCRFFFSFLVCLISQPNFVLFFFFHLKLISMTWMNIIEGNNFLTFAHKHFEISFASIWWKCWSLEKCSVH